MKITNRPKSSELSPLRPRRTNYVAKSVVQQSEGILFSEGDFPLENLYEAVSNLTEKIKSGDTEIYNEFSLQHELGILLRKILPGKKIQFERNVSFFGFPKTELEKREIDIVVLDGENQRMDAAIELKYPRNGQHPEQMFSFCKDVVFAEQLRRAGFNKAFVVIFAEDPLFYEGNPNGIYAYFRGGSNLSGKIVKPTGKRDQKLIIAGNYRIEWHDVVGPLKYTIVEAF